MKIVGGEGDDRESGIGDSGGSSGAVRVGDDASGSNGAIGRSDNRNHVCAIADRCTNQSARPVSPGASLTSHARGARRIRDAEVGVSLAGVVPKRFPMSTPPHGQRRRVDTDVAPEHESAVKRRPPAEQCHADALPGGPVEHELWRWRWRSWWWRRL